jgi:hypothetical protein
MRGYIPIRIRRKYKHYGNLLSLDEARFSIESFVTSDTVFGRTAMCLFYVQTNSSIATRFVYVFKF